MQVERAINKIAQKFPNLENNTALTDIHIRVSQDSGELLAFDDDDREITRCVVEQWIESKDEHFYHSVTHILQGCLRRLNNVVERMGILRPFSFVRWRNMSSCIISRRRTSMWGMSDEGRWDSRLRQTNL